MMGQLNQSLEMNGPHDDKDTYMRNHIMKHLNAQLETAYAGTRDIAPEVTGVNVIWCEMTPVSKIVLDIQLNV
jgi:hypothetical protein